MFVGAVAVLTGTVASSSDANQQLSVDLPQLLLEDECNSLEPNLLQFRAGYGQKEGTATLQDCPAPCMSFVYGASVQSVNVCFNSAKQICGADDPCPEMYPACKQIPDTELKELSQCSAPCRRWVNGASPHSEKVCLNARAQICGGEEHCPSWYPACRQIHSPERWRYAPGWWGRGQRRGPGQWSGWGGADDECPTTCWKSSPSKAGTHQNGVTYRTVSYGKYYSKHGSSCDKSANSFTVFHKSGATGKQPTVIHIHGGGFTGGRKFSYPTPQITPYLEKGFTYISMDYRLVATKYYFQTCSGQEHEEEFIAASADGKLSVSGRIPLSDYKVKVARTEFMTKCVFDAVQAMEFIIQHSEELLVDPHRIGFIASSAGTAEANYLTWTYPRLKPGLYTPMSLTLTNAQLDYPVQDALDKVWSYFADELGNDALLSHYLSQEACATIVGNPWCQRPAGEDQPQLCNSTWQELSMARLCGSNFEKVTMGELVKMQVWKPMHEQQKGIAYLWYISNQMKRSQQMQSHRPNPVIYVRNVRGGAGDKSWSALVHSAVFAKKYLDLCKELGLRCVSEYAEWPGIKATSRGMEKGGLRYGETFDWQSISAKDNTANWRTGDEELLIHVFAASHQQ